MIVNNVRSMNYRNIVLFSYGTVFNQEIVETYLADYQIEIIEVLLDDVDEKACFTHLPVEILGRFKNLKVAARDQMYSKFWFNQLHTPHKVSFIPDDLLFIHPDLQEIQPTIQVDSVGYVVLEAYQSLDIIALELDDFKAFAGDMKRLYNLDVVFLPLNIGNGGIAQGRYLKARIPELILVDYSGRRYVPIQDVLHILLHAEMVITSRYHALVLSIANKVPILSVMKDGVGDKRYYYNKNGGLIQQVFKGLKIDETRLTKRTFTDTFDLVKENLTI